MRREIQTVGEREREIDIVVGRCVWFSLCMARGEGGCGGGSTMLSDFNKGSASLTSDVIPNKELSVQRVGRVSSRRSSSAQSVSQVWLIFRLPGLGWREQVREEEDLSVGRAGSSGDTLTNTSSSASLCRYQLAVCVSVMAICTYQ